MISKSYFAESVPQEYIVEAVVNTDEIESHYRINWEYVLVGVYSMISLIFFIRFVKNIKILVYQIQRNVKVSYRGQTLVLLKEESLPYSFLNYIFVSEVELENGKFIDAIFAHECTHIKEKHSWDNLFVEAVLVAFWFHPGLYWAKASFKLNHEFIADEVALCSISSENYERQLLAMMISSQRCGLASSLNFSLTKKRFEMMKRKSMSSGSWINILVLIPVLAMMVYFFIERVAAKGESEKTPIEVYVNASNIISDVMNFELVLELNEAKRCDCF